MITDCSLCNMATGGKHERDCPWCLETETLTMSKEFYDSLVPYGQYRKERLLKEDGGL